MSKIEVMSLTIPNDEVGILKRSIGWYEKELPDRHQVIDLSANLQRQILLPIIMIGANNHDKLASGRLDACSVSVSACQSENVSVLF